MWGKSGARVIASEAMWKEPVKWNQLAAEAQRLHTINWRVDPTNDHYAVPPTIPRPRVFCASLADVFEGEDTMPENAWESVRQARARLFRLIEATPNLDWLLLTKRPENVLQMIPQCGFPTVGVPGTLGRYCLPDNVWIGTTVENQEMANERIPHLLRIFAKVRFLSVEPQLGPIELSNISGWKDPAKWLGKPILGGTDGIHWVICGGESGGEARPFQIEWARSLREQCAAMKVSFFMKQMGSNPTCKSPPILGGEKLIHINLKHAKGEDMAEWPSDLRIQEFPKIDMTASDMTA
jgi:protein gp37